MEYDLFVEMMNKISRWCNKALNEIQREIYWEKINKIPDMAFRDIIETLIEETLPGGKLPKPDDISLGWFHWRQQHPKSITYEKSWCDECEGDGAFSVWYQDYLVPKDEIPADENQNKYISWFRMFVPCKKCSNWKRQFPTKGSLMPKRFYIKSDILDKGWKLSDPFMDRFLENKKRMERLKNEQ